MPSILTHWIFVGTLNFVQGIGGLVKQPLLLAVSTFSKGVVGVCGDGYDDCGDDAGNTPRIIKVPKNCTGTKSRNG